MSRTKKIAVLAIIAMVLTMLPVQLFAASTSAESTRLFGNGRVETALEVCKAGWTTADTVIVAPADQANLVDALAAAPLAGQENAPILLTFKGTLDAAVKAKISALGAKKVYVVGAISDSVKNEIASISGVTVEALKGSSRWDTAKAINAKLTNPAGSFIVGYAALADALSVSSYAAANKYAIILADVNGNIPVAQSVLGSKTYLVGGSTLVADIAGATRLAGSDRFETNKKVLETLTFDYGRVYVANGFNNHLVDSLVAAPLAAKAKAPIVLANETSVGAADVVNGKVTAQTTVVALGGSGVVSDSVRDTVKFNTPATFAVEDITVVSRDAFKVKFNQKVDEDSAENTAAYKIDGSTIPVGSKAVLQSDGVTVLVVVDSVAGIVYDQYQKITVEVVSQRVYNESKASAAGSMTKVLEMKDVDVPVLASVKATGNKKVTVVFSEPVDMTGLGSGSWQIDGQNLSSLGLTNTIPKDLTTGTKTLGTKVELYFGTAISAGTHTFKVKDGTGPNGALTDSAQFVFAAQTQDFTVESATGAPKVESVTCTNNTIYVTFDRAMYQNPIAANDAGDPDSALRLLNYEVNSTIGSGLNTASSVKFKSGSGSKIVELGAATGRISVGTNVVEIDKDLKDAWGNKLSSGTDNLRFSFTYTADNTKPTVTSVSCISSSKVRIQFSEKVDGTFATTVNNYKIKKSDGTQIYGSTGGGTAAMIASTPTSNADTVELTLATGDFRGTGYTIEISNIRDIAVNPNIIDKYTTTFDGVDDLGPVVSKVYRHGTDATKAIVIFSEKMDSSTITADNFGYQAGNLEAKNLPSGTTVSIDGTGKIVTVDFPAAYTVAAVGNGAGIDANGDGAQDKYDVNAIRVSNVKDTAGNALQGVASTTLTTATVAGTDGPAYVANSFVMMDSGDDVRVEFELNQEVTNLNRLDFAVQGIDAAGAKKDYTPDAGYTSGKKVILTYSDTTKRDALKKIGKNALLLTWTGVDTTTAGAATGGHVAAGGVGTSANTAGVTVNNFGAGKLVYDDQVKPKVLAIALVDGAAGATPAIAPGRAVVSVTFTEDIDPTILGLYTDDFIFSSSGTVYEPPTPSYDGSGGAFMASDVLYFNCAAAAALTEASIFVQAESDSAKISVRDLADAKDDRNTWVPSSTNKTGVNATDSMAPVLVSWTMNMAANGDAKSITLTFNEPVTAANVNLAQLSVDRAATGAAQVLTAGTKVQTSPRVITVNALGAATTLGIHTAADIKTSAAAAYTLVIGAAAFTDGTTATGAIANYGAPATFTADTVAPKMTAFAQTTNTTVTATFDDYVDQVKAAVNGNWLTAGIAAATTGAVPNANGLSAVLTITAPTVGLSTISATGGAANVTDIGGNNFDATADLAKTLGAAVPAANTPVWTI